MTEDGQDNPSSAELYEHMEEGRLDSFLESLEKIRAEREAQKKTQSSTDQTSQGMSTEDLKTKDSEMESRFGKDWRV